MTIVHLTDLMLLFYLYVIAEKLQRAEIESWFKTAVC